MTKPNNSRKENDEDLGNNNNNNNKVGPISLVDKITESCKPDNDDITTNDTNLKIKNNSSDAKNKLLTGLEMINNSAIETYADKIKYFFNVPDYLGRFLAYFGNVTRDTDRGVFQMKLLTHISGPDIIEATRNVLNNDSLNDSIMKTFFGYTLKGLTAEKDIMSIDLRAFPEYNGFINSMRIESSAINDYVSLLYMLPRSRTFYAGVLEYATQKHNWVAENKSVRQVNYDIPLITVPSKIIAEYAQKMNIENYGELMAIKKI